MPTPSPTTPALSSPRSAVVVFARAPEREAKALGLGARRAQRLSQGLLQRTLDVAETVKDRARIIVVSDGAIDVKPHVMQLEQRGTDFGTRFLAAVEDVLSLGFTRIVVVGADIPRLSAQDLEIGLASGEVCVGPSADGGFYLVGLNPEHASLLHDLPWQRRTLLSVLLHRAGDPASEKKPVILPVRRDIDDADDVRLLQAELDRICRYYVGLTLRLGARVRPTLRRFARPRTVVTGIEPALRRDPPACA